MIEKKAIIKNKMGIHMRPADRLVRIASRFSSEVKLVKGSLSVDAKSIMGILMLEAAKDTEVIIQARGVDDIEAVEALKELIDNEFKIRFKLTKKSLDQLKEESLSIDVLAKLKGLENKEYVTEKRFVHSLEATIGEDQTIRYKASILKHSSLKDD